MSFPYQPLSGINPFGQGGPPTGANWENSFWPPSHLNSRWHATVVRGKEELKIDIQDNGDRVEFYSWEVEVPVGFQAFTYDFALPTAIFRQGVLSILPRIVSKYAGGTFLLEIPPLLPLGGGSDSAEACGITWKVDRVPELHFLYNKQDSHLNRGNTGDEVTVLMPFQGVSQEGGNIYAVPRIKITHGNQDVRVERLKLCVAIAGKTGFCDPTQRPSTTTTADLYTSISSLFNESDMSDVMLCCEGETFYCHRIILSVNSPVFKQMFMSDTREAKEGQVEIQEVDKGVLQLMLQWMYGVDVKPSFGSFELAMGLLKLADRYLVDSLGKVLEEDILNGVTVENAFEVYVVGDACAKERLKKKATEVMKRNRQEIFANDELFQECCKRFPKLLQEICTQ